MRKIHFLLLLLLLLSVLYVVTEYASLFAYSEAVAALTIPVISVFYLITGENKMPYFTSFLVLYSLAHLLIFVDISSVYEHFHYYLGNILYISAYMFLIFEVLKDIPFKGVVPRFNLTIIILLLLNSYVLFTLLNWETSRDYFFRVTSDTLVTVKEEASVPLEESIVSIILEFSYNLVILVLLNVSFINYLYRENKKASLLFIGTLCVVFSELIQYAIYYPSDVVILNIVCYLLMLVGFLCFYLFAIQSIKMEDQTFKEV
ncbi:hypothetical protein ACFFVB_14455 [Formosa undariae]|uniref:Uncharacterized protein n=1 Tax=Formosa undariae TaxID=1325436 RepID=A0ABV5F4A9_9FLAO